MSIDIAVQDILVGDLGLPSRLVEQGGLFSESGLDSLDRVRFLEILEERFVVKIAWSEVSAENFDTVRDIAYLIESIRGRCSPPIAESILHEAKGDA